MIEVYTEYPWVKEQADDQEYILINEAHGMVYYDMNGNKKEFPIGQLPCRTYVNQNYIVTVHDEMLYDSEMTAYPSCIIEMSNGDIYYLPCLWAQRDQEGN